ncbi:MAG: hypothetical protein J5685_05755 [Clostridiales bacterium]|nr:hypothetical protein [Clostridiales bacterium]
MSVSRSAKRLCCLMATVLALSGCSGQQELSESAASLTEETSADSEGTISSVTSEETEGETEAESETEETEGSEEIEETEPGMMLDPHGYDDLLEDEAYIVMADDSTIDIDDFVSSEEYIFVRNDRVSTNGVTTSMIDTSREYPGYAEGDCRINVTQDICLPSRIDDIDIIWESSDESLIGTNGSVTRPHEHSMFVILTGTYVMDGKVIRVRYPVRVARDMYEDVTTDMVVDLEFYDQYWVFEEMGLDVMDFDYPGWFYEYQEMGQLVFFEADPDNLTVRDRSDEAVCDMTLFGTLSEMGIETADEAYLFLYTFRNLIGWTDLYDMHLSGMDTGTAGQFYYDFVPYYNGIPTNGSVRVTISRFDDVKTVSSRILTIPSGFDTEPSVTYEDAVSLYGIAEPELMIVKYEGSVSLVWTGYADGNLLWIDAHTGETILNTSAAVVTID